MQLDRLDRRMHLPTRLADHLEVLVIDKVQRHTMQGSLLLHPIQVARLIRNLYKPHEEHSSRSMHRHLLPVTIPMGLNQAITSSQAHLIIRVMELRVISIMVVRLE